MNKYVTGICWIFFVGFVVFQYAGLISTVQLESLIRKPYATFSGLAEEKNDKWGEPRGCFKFKTREKKLNQRRFESTFRVWVSECDILKSILSSTNVVYSQVGIWSEDPTSKNEDKAERSFASKAKNTILEALRFLSSSRFAWLHIDLIKRNLKRETRLRVDFFDWMTRSFASHF